jgi:hypothetical protein
MFRNDVGRLPYPYFFRKLHTEQCIGNERVDIWLDESGVRVLDGRGGQVSLVSMVIKKDLV